MLWNSLSNERPHNRFRISNTNLPLRFPCLLLDRTDSLEYTLYFKCIYIQHMYFIVMCLPTPHLETSVCCVANVVKLYCICICICLPILRKPNSIIALLFNQNIFTFLKEFRHFALCFSAHQNNTTLSPGFLGQRFNNLQRVALLTLF